MPPTKIKKCCVPYCPNIQGESKKQFFNIGANLRARAKLGFQKNALSKSQILQCCEDHFDLPNDAANYIKYKYCPGTKLKLRPESLPHRKLPVNVCRLCLNLIYNGDDVVDVSDKNGKRNAKIIAALLPDIDLSLTVEPVVCIKCFEPLEKTYNIKQNVLKSEVIVVNCIKSVVKRSPKRFISSCEIDLFDEYHDIKELLQQEKEKERLELAKDNEMRDQQPDIEKDTEEIVIQVENQEDSKYSIAELVEANNVVIQISQQQPNKTSTGSFQSNDDVSEEKDEKNVIVPVTLDIRRESGDNDGITREPEGEGDNRNMYMNL